MYPFSRLTQSGDNFYGVTEGEVDGESGEQDGPGGTFRLSDGGKLTTLDEFPQVDQDYTSPPFQTPDWSPTTATFTAPLTARVLAQRTVFKMTPSGDSDHDL